MTTEPKFIPKEAVSVHISDDIQVKIRLIDCVGFMVDGASGHMEDDKTGWLRRRGMRIRFLYKGSAYRHSESNPGSFYYRACDYNGRQFR